MNCQDFWNSLSQRGHAVTDEQATHLAECTECAAQWEPHRALTAGLHSLVHEWRQVRAPDRVEAGLAAAFRAHAFHAPRAPRHSWWKPVFVWAAAAAGMIFCAGLLLRSWQTVPTRPDSFAAPHRQAQPAAVYMASADSESEDDNSALGEGFVRLPNAPSIEPNESYDVVRVAFPGSEMIALGLPVSEDRAGETVMADVALAADGTARAVRLVSDGGSL